MAETETRIEQPDKPEPQKLVPAPGIDLVRAARMGMIAGLALVFIAAVGMVIAFQVREVIAGLSFANLLLVVIPFMFGYMGGTPPEQREGSPGRSRAWRSASSSHSSMPSTCATSFSTSLPSSWTRSP